MRTITAKTDVLAHDNWFPKGTGFKVVETPDPKAKPPQIDPRTVRVWLQNDWAAEDAGSARKAKA